jgi:hypothetical protein
MEMDFQSWTNFTVAMRLRRGNTDSDEPFEL